MSALIRKNWFLLALLLTLAAAITLPAPGRQAALGGLSGRIAVVLIFVSTGLTMPSESILRRLGDLRLHLLVQGFVFVFVPLLVFLTATPLFAGLQNGAVLAGIYGLAVLPTTISSCIVFTARNRGNTWPPVNAALANVIGVFVALCSFR